MNAIVGAAGGLSYYYLMSVVFKLNLKVIEKLGYMYRRANIGET